MPAGTTLTEPLKIAEFQRNRRNETVRVSLEPFEDRTLLHVRQYYLAKDGTMQPTRKGVCIAVQLLPELESAIAKATEKARELGMIEAKGAA